MTRFAPVYRALGMIVMLFGLTMLAPLILSYAVDDGAQAAYDEAFGLTMLSGAFLWYRYRRCKRELNIRDGFLMVVLVWTVLLSPVSRQLTLLALFIDLVAHGVQVVALLDLIATLFPLAEAPYLEAFTSEQLAALARMASRGHGYGFGVSLLFTGCFLLIAGYLIRKSGYLPRPIGVLYQLAGAAYVANTFALLLAPTWSARIALAAAPFVLTGEVGLATWLLVKGIDPERWNRRQPIGQGLAARFAG